MKNKCPLIKVTHTHKNMIYPVIFFILHKGVMLMSQHYTLFYVNY